MELNNTQLKIIRHITQKIEVSVSDLSISLNISISLIYKHLNDLTINGFLEKKGNKFVISSNIFARFLSNLIMDDPTLIDVLKNEGIPILMSLINRDDIGIQNLSKKVGLNPSSIYPYIRKFVNRQIIYKKQGILIFNKDLWEKLYQFISFYRNYYILSQFKKVPNNAKIYFESPYEIVFSLTTEISFAQKTAFSVYGDYGIKLMEKEIFYRLDHLPKKKLDIQIIFLDSLRVAGSENEESARRRLYCYLFYKKNIKHLKKIKNYDLDILRKIVDGETDKEIDFPTKKEIIKKCEEYDIQF